MPRTQDPAASLAATCHLPHNRQNASVPSAPQDTSVLSSGLNASFITG